MSNLNNLLLQQEIGNLKIPLTINNFDTFFNMETCLETLSLEKAAEFVQIIKITDAASSPIIDVADAWEELKSKSFNFVLKFLEIENKISSAWKGDTADALVAAIRDLAISARNASEVASCTVSALYSIHRARSITLNPGFAACPSPEQVKRNRQRMKELCRNELGIRTVEIARLEKTYQIWRSASIQGFIFYYQKAKEAQQYLKQALENNPTELMGIFD